MLDVEEQLRRYGTALERRLAGDEAPLATTKGRRSHPLMVVAAAAMVLVVAVSAVVLVGVVDDDGSEGGPHVSAGDARGGVFSTATNVVLVFSDGIDGVTAVDLDRRRAGRRVIEGERAGDQQFRLTVTGGHLVVGWGAIHAMPLSGAAATKIDDATIYLPAAEPGEVWTLTWDGGRIGQGDATIRRVRVDGTVVFSSDELETGRFTPLLGVPGGLAVESPDGVAVWDAVSGTVGPILGPGPASGISSDGRRLAWCEATCETVHRARLDRTGLPTAPHVAPGRQLLALAPDRRHLAVLRPSGGVTSLVIVELTTGEESIEATSLDQHGSLQWTADGEQLFYTEDSYLQPSTRIGRYTVADRTWEAHTIPVGDGLAALALDPDQAGAFFDDDHVDPVDCPGAAGHYPSGREDVCTFTF